VSLDIEALLSLMLETPIYKNTSPKVFREAYNLELSALAVD
jgi:hypothetical protein